MPPAELPDSSERASFLVARVFNGILPIFAPAAGHMEDKRPVRFGSYCPLIFRVGSRPSFLLAGGFMWRVGLIRPAVSLLTAAMDFPLAALARELLPQRRGQAWSNDCRGCSWADDAATTPSDFESNRRKSKSESISIRRSRRLSSGSRGSERRS